MPIALSVVDSNEKDSSEEGDSEHEDEDEDKDKHFMSLATIGDGQKGILDKPRDRGQVTVTQPKNIGGISKPKHKGKFRILFFRESTSSSLRNCFMRPKKIIKKK